MTAEWGSPEDIKTQALLNAADFKIREKALAAAAVAYSRPQGQRDRGFEDLIRTSEQYLRTGKTRT